jgi:hypothetical protein
VLGFVQSGSLSGRRARQRSSRRSTREAVTPMRLPLRAERSSLSETARGRPGVVAPRHAASVRPLRAKLGCPSAETRTAEGALGVDRARGWRTAYSSCGSAGLGWGFVPVDSAAADGCWSRRKRRRAAPEAASGGGQSWSLPGWPEQSGKRGAVLGGLGPELAVADEGHVDPAGSGPADDALAPPAGAVGRARWPGCARPCADGAQWLRTTRRRRQ